MTRPEPHAISDSELPVVGKKKHALRKTKPALVEPPVGETFVTNVPTLQASAAVAVISNQDKRELAEMCSMFQGIKGLTERNVAMSS